MDFQNFLTNKIKLLARQFSYLGFKAEQNEISGFYFVEVTPMEEFRNNNILAKQIRDIYLEQLEKYPSESLSFITTDSYYKITTPFLDIEAKHYELSNIISS
ncbi:MAG TPA: hypothetical protein VFW07_14665 [Parafilimonas sp.]|nr:hypothetical protein [Parafilimonas sp.]